MARQGHNDDGAEQEQGPIFVRKDMYDPEVDDSRVHTGFDPDSSGFDRRVIDQEYPPEELEEPSALNMTKVAYADTQNSPYENERRSLAFHGPMVSAKTAAECAAFVPGYNAYDGENMAETIHKIADRSHEAEPDPQFSFGRESSPVVYIWTDEPARAVEAIREMDSDEAIRRGELYDELHEIQQKTGLGSEGDGPRLSPIDSPEQARDKVLQKDSRKTRVADRAASVVEELDSLDTFAPRGPDEFSVSVGTGQWPAYDEDAETYNPNSDDYEGVPARAEATLRLWWD